MASLKILLIHFVRYFFGRIFTDYHRRSETLFLGGATDPQRHRIIGGVYVCKKKNYKCTNLADF